MIEARQLALDLPHREALGREDFLVSASNSDAVSAIDAWPDWPQSGLVLTGPEGSGKSHLVEVWRQRSGALRLAGRDVAGDPGEILGDAPAVAIEDCGPRCDRPTMFHLLNVAERSGVHTLLTGTAELYRWAAGLPDLASRVRRLPLVELQAPDDLLLRAVLIKLFADRQLAIDAALVAYLATRIERSLAAARDVVARLDRAAIEEKRPVTRALAARILSETVEKPE